MSNEEDTTGSESTHVTILDVVDALYVLSRLDPEADSHSLSDLQFQVGSKSTKGRYVNKLLVWMLNGGIVKVGARRGFALTEAAAPGAEYLFGYHLNDMGRNALLRAGEGQLDSFEKQGLAALGMIDKDSELTPLGTSVALILRQHLKADRA